jgi:hypothetical protein
VDPGRDVELLVSQVVEIEDDGVGLPAVGTRMSLEVVEQEQDAFAEAPIVADAGLLDVALLVRRIVLLAVGTPAGLAVAITTPTASLRSEFIDRLRLAATTASPKLIHEHMFASGPDGTLP